MSKKYNGTTDVNKIHGTDVRYYISIGGVRTEEREFSISGFGVTSRDIKREKRFHELIKSAPTISFVTDIETF